MKYKKPNFEREWYEAIRYPEFEEMGRKGWLEFTSQNFIITNYENIKDTLNNVNLDYDSLEQEKKDRFERDFKKGRIEIPIVVKFSEDDYDLLGGNTRLAGLIKNGINPKLWVVDLSNNEEINEKWSQKYKDSIDCSNPKGFSQKAHCQGKKKVNEGTLKGGLSDGKTLMDLAKIHAYDDSTDSTSKEKILGMFNELKSQLRKGIEVEKEHTKDESKAREIAMDHLYEDPKYYDKLSKIEASESTGADSAGAFVGSLSSQQVKRKIDIIHNLKEAMASDASGAYDVPFGDGSKNPLKINGPDSIKKSRAVKDKKFPKYGGPGGIFIKIKDKCKKFPYCNQGDIKAIEQLEIAGLKEAIENASKTYGIPYSEMEKVVLNEINKIFIK